jgi:hypothetical protein
MASNGDDAQHHTYRAAIEATFNKFSQLIKAMTGPVNAPYPYRPNNDPAPPKGGVIADILSSDHKALKTMMDLFQDKLNGVQNDNELLLERLVETLSSLPADSKQGKQFTDSFVNELWTALPHPPITSMAKKYQFRDADGANNNIDHPDLGQAGTAYARSARSSAIQNIGLPEPEDIFDTIMVRNGKFEAHPNKISSMLFYLAAIIIHDLFRTVSCLHVFCKGVS